MPSDYETIRAENELRYGTAIGRIGPMLLADRYDDRTHFIFELLQNAEDAMARRVKWDGPRAVEFSLLPDALNITHFGKPFDEDDVRGICGIGESTKDLTAIGRFGIGFKSVYAFTDSPEIHSGMEHFAIDSFVWPRAVPGSPLPGGRTEIRLPLLRDDVGAVSQIQEGLQRLGPRTLLFLKEIGEISWSVSGGPSGLYLRERSNALGGEVSRVMVIGQDHATDEVEEEHWLVFSRPVSNNEGGVGFVEVAFSLDQGEDSDSWSVRRITDSPLVVFFPTVLSTNLGFLLQGPFRTTPSRDNVPVGDPWNKYLVKETSVLLIDALRELRSLGLLDVSALRSLPLDSSRFVEGTRFAPLFSSVRDALMKECLLPGYKAGFVTGLKAKISRTQDLRDLIGTKQLVELFQSDDELSWLSEEITVDRTPDLRTYLMEELHIDEVTPEWLVSNLTKPFLEAQPDEWIERLYSFLNGQGALLRRLRTMPLIRLEDGSHVVAHNGHQPQAFLPVGGRTGFPTVRKCVCSSEHALAFLKALGLSPPDPVDDVISNVLPKYVQEDVDIPDPDYNSDIERILSAFDTDSTSQRQKLLSALEEVSFVRAVDSGSGSHQFVRTADAYQATQRLKQLFESVPGVLVVDDSKDYLRGDRIRSLLEAAGCPLYLLPVRVKSTLTPSEKFDLRRSAGTADITSEKDVRDSRLSGLQPLLATIRKLPHQEAINRARLLWEALCDVERRRGPRVFQGLYRWMRYEIRRASFDASFVRLLNEAPWVPDEGGQLRLPGDVLFESTGWETNPFLQSKIHFKPPIIDELAREAGIEPEVLTLLTRHGLTGVEELTAQLVQAGIIEDVDAPEDPSSVEKALGEFLGEIPDPTGPVPEPPEPGGNSNSGSGGSKGGVGQGGHPGLANNGSPSTTGHGAQMGGGKTFVSYVSLDLTDEEEADPDGLSQQERIDLEERAITLIIEGEPELKRTPTNNPGFDLSEVKSNGQPIRWVEVKAMKGTLKDRPVGLSRTQFEFAQKHGQTFWLYVVENAGSPELGRIVKIQDPAGKSKTFTFDRGWLTVADGT